MAISQATTADLTSRSLRPLTTEETAWGVVRLRDAFTQILTTIPAAATRLDAGVHTSPFNQLVIQVQVAMVLRVLANPEYIRQQGINDAQVILDQAVSSGALYLTDNEIALLSTAVTAGGASSAANVRALPDVEITPAWWLAHGTTTL